MPDEIKRIVVLGGGSAGWLTAALLAVQHGHIGGGSIEVTLLESANTPTIGVGEGTWPSMRDTLHRIGISETQLVRDCDAAFKQGSRFDGWVTGRDGDSYYHPFTQPHGYGEVDLASAWLDSQSSQPFAECVGAQAQICTHGLGPKQVTTPEFSAVTNYGYHFDAVKLGLLLRKHAVDRLGVRHVVDEMIAVRSHENGDIASLQTRTQGEIEGDLFIDCSGMPSLLIGQHYGVPFKTQQHVLFNDTALAVQVPYSETNAALASQTISTAHPEGWTWDIGLPSRRGVGLVYSSAHTSADAAEKALRNHLQRTGGPAIMPTPRKITFSPGYRERFWHRNCVAIGLSSGFIEPLEASALALVELSAAMISDEMPANRVDMDLVGKRFNEVFSYRWSRVIEFLKLHYVLNKREDSDYWCEHRNPDTVPERLQELLQLWQHRAPYRHDFNRLEEVFPSASYQYVLYGMGFRPTLSGRRPPQMERAQKSFQEATTITNRLLGGLPRHRELIAYIHQHGMPLH